VRLRVDVDGEDDGRWLAEVAELPSTRRDKLTSLLRTIAPVVLVAGAAMSLMLMFRGHRHAPFVLMILFTGWVMSPFLVLAYACLSSKRFSGVNRARVHLVALIISAASVAVYAGLIPMPSGSAPAFVFLMVPAVSWVLMTVLALAVSRADRTQAARSSSR
jgi:hypothetical protein